MIINDITHQLKIILNDIRKHIQIKMNIKLELVLFFRRHPKYIYLAAVEPIFKLIVRWLNIMLSR